MKTHVALALCAVLCLVVHGVSAVQTEEQLRNELCAEHNLCSGAVRTLQTWDRVMTDATDRGVHRLYAKANQDEDLAHAMHKLHALLMDSDEEVQDQDEYLGAVSGSGNIWNFGNIGPNGDLLYAFLSRAVYDRSKPLPVGLELRFSNGWSSKSLKVVKRIDVRSSSSNAVVFRSGSSIYVAFRGSESNSMEHFYKDWVKTNGNVLKTSACFGSDGCVSGRAHSGFLRSFNDVRGSWDFRSLLSSYRSSTWYFTGHSLGGAMATLAGSWAAKKGLRIGAVVTFGSPRVGDSSYASGFNSAVGRYNRRYVNEYTISKCGWFGSVESDADSEVMDSEEGKRVRTLHLLHMMKLNPQASRALVAQLTSVSLDQIQDFDTEQKVDPAWKDQMVSDSNEIASTLSGWINDINPFGTSTGQDLVTLLPPSEFGYTAVSGKRGVKCPTSCSGFCCGLTPSRIASTGICHTIDNYITALGGK